MISVFVSRDSGFGMPVSPGQLNAIKLLKSSRWLQSQHLWKRINICAELSDQCNKGQFLEQLPNGPPVGRCRGLLESVQPPGYEFCLFDHSQGHPQKKDGTAS